MLDKPRWIGLGTGKICRESPVCKKNNEMLDQILISHDAGWYDPQKEEQPIQPYTNIFEKLYPKLISKGFIEEDFHQLLSNNPSHAFSIRIRKGSF